MLRRSLNVIWTCLPFEAVHAKPYSNKSSQSSQIEKVSQLATKRRRLPSTRQEMYEALFQLSPDSPPHAKVLKVGMLGLPGVGKSSLVNRLSMFQACATSQKINTTRTKQNVVFTQDDTQLVFMDLPGVMASSKARRHNVAKSIIRDPHAGIYQSDIICVVVDASSYHMRHSLDKDILRALHFFDDKPTILVLTKTDRLQRRRFRLLDATRLLSDGVVGGKIIYQNKYDMRYGRSPPNVDIPLLSDTQSSPRLSDKQHFKSLSDEEILQELEANWELNADEEKSLEERLVDDKEEAGEEEEQEENVHDEEISLERTSLEEAFSENLSKENLQSNIDLYFDQMPMEQTKELPELQTTRREVDPILALLRKQMMLESASREEVALRVRKWHQLEDRVRGQIGWPNFGEVFMVSSATGTGISELRNYLLSQAKPGVWAYHSSLVSDQDPYDTVTYAIQAHCLNLLSQEIPYSLTVQVTDYDKDDEGAIFAEADILCKTERQMKKVLGKNGDTVKLIVGNAMQDLEQAFQTSVNIKLSVKMAKIPKKHLKYIKKSGNFRKAFPQLDL